MKIRRARLILGALLGCFAAGQVLAADVDAALPSVHVYQSGEAGIFANAYLVETAHGVVAIDATLTNSDSNALHAMLVTLNKPLLAVLLTHGHPDHYNGVTNLLAGRRIPVIATPAVSEVIARDDAGKETQWRPVFKDEWPLARTFPNRALESGKSVSFDGVKFTVHALGPGESHADSIWVLTAPNLRVAFIGDVVLDGVHAYLSDGHSGLWLQNIERVRKLTRDASRLYPGHGAAGGPQLLDSQRDYLIAYRQNVTELAQGRPALDDAQETQLEQRMLAFRNSTRLQFLIKLGADPVARELATGGVK
jgi:glyoxylase-like metal-dependent hydrolase (beta-lactamase superfamily II)